MESLYTRNYRIQHSAGRTEQARDDESTAKVSNGCEREGEDFGVHREEESIDEKALFNEDPAQCALSERAEVETEALPDEKECLDGDDLKPARPRPVRRFRVRSPLESQKNDDICISSAETILKKKESAETERRAEPVPDKNCTCGTEKHMDKKLCGGCQGVFGLKNFTPEDIFLCAILLLLLNEGCEDIMTLILGFLLIS